MLELIKHQSITFIYRLHSIIVLAQMRATSISVVLAVVAASLASPTKLYQRDATTAKPFILERDHAPLCRRQSPNYHQDYTTGGDVVYTPNGNSFTVDWETQDDFVVGLGWSTGSTT